MIPSFINTVPSVVFILFRDVEKGSPTLSTFLNGVPAKVPQDSIGGFS